VPNRSEGSGVSESPSGPEGAVAKESIPAKQQHLSFEAIRARIMKTIRGDEHLDFSNET